MASKIAALNTWELDQSFPYVNREMKELYMGADPAIPKECETEKATWLRVKELWCEAAEVLDKGDLATLNDSALRMVFKKNVKLLKHSISSGDDLGSMRSLHVKVIRTLFANAKVHSEITDEQCEVFGFYLNQDDLDKLEKTYNLFVQGTRELLQPQSSGGGSLTFVPPPFTARDASKVSWANRLSRLMGNGPKIIKHFDREMLGKHFVLYSNVYDNKSEIFLSSLIPEVYDERWPEWEPLVAQCEFIEYHWHRIFRLITLGEGLGPAEGSDDQKPFRLALGKTIFTSLKAVQSLNRADALYKRAQEVLELNKEAKTIADLKPIV